MLHMTPADVLDGHTAAEFIGWRYYLEWKSAEQKREELKAETAAKAKSQLPYGR